MVTQARRFSALQGLDEVLSDTSPVEALAIAPSKADLYELEAPSADEGRYPSADVGEIAQRLD